MMFKMDYVANKERDVKSKKFKKIYRNLNFALQEIMKEASIIGDSKDLTSDNFLNTSEVKVTNEIDGPGEKFSSEEESVFEEEGIPLQSDEGIPLQSDEKIPLQSDEEIPLQSDEDFDFKSPNLLPINSRPNSVQNRRPSSLDSSDRETVNLKLKCSDGFEEVPVKYSSPEKRSNKGLSNRETISVNKNSNSCKRYKCHEPLCSYVTLDCSNFRKHTIRHFKCKLREKNISHSPSKGLSNCEEINVDRNSNSRKRYKCHEPLCTYVTLSSSDFRKHTLKHFKCNLRENNICDSVRQRIPRSGKSNRIEMESNPVKHYDSLTSVRDDGNSPGDETVNCSLCDFFCFTSVELKRHYSRNHSNREILESSQEFNFSESECTNSSDVSLNSDDQLRRCSFCSFECHSSLIRKHEQEHHLTVGDRLAVASKSFKCFECDFETPHKITLVRHEKKHANFINKAKIKYNISHSSSNSLKSAESVQNEQCNFKRISLNTQNVNKFDQNKMKRNLKAGCDYRDSYLEEYQPFRVDIDFKEEERDYPTVERREIRITTSDETATKYRKVGDEYYCKSCSYRTPRIPYIRTHILIHLKEKRLKCEHCNYATNLVRNLQQHELIHRKIKKYSCKLCVYQSNHLQNIRSHFEQIHVPDMP